MADGSTSWFFCTLAAGKIILVTMLDRTHLFCQEELAGDRMCHPVSRRRLARLVASKEKAESPFAGGNNLAAAEEERVLFGPPSLTRHNQSFPSVS